MALTKHLTCFMYNVFCKDCYQVFISLCCFFYYNEILLKVALNTININLKNSYYNAFLGDEVDLLPVMLDLSALGCCQPGIDGR